MIVFVSSTCYDLVDLRGELFEELRDLGVEVRCSEIKESDFEVSGHPAENSIETCLANVRASDVVIVILSQRYGPRLSAYGGVSATHREYLEATAEKKRRILFYVRDCLEADYRVWERNEKQSGFKGAWARDPRDAEGLFKMIDEHRRYIQPDGATDKNNWFDSFRSSVDLRANIRQRLARDAMRANAEHLIDRGQVPILVANIDDAGGSGDRLVINVRFNNVGPVAAIEVQARACQDGEADESTSRYSSIAPGTHRGFTFRLPLTGSSPIRISASYLTPFGHELEDCFSITRSSDGLGHPKYLGKRILDCRSFVLPSDKH